MKMADLMCVELKLAVPCMKCKASVPVNGPREVSRCGECDTDTPLTGALRWRELLLVRSQCVDADRAADHDSFTLGSSRA